MSYKIIGKYIKELKFDIPSPKTFFLLSKDITNYKINILRRGYSFVSKKYKATYE